MDAEKKQLIQGFNIELFFEWQGQFYEHKLVMGPQIKRWVKFINDLKEGNEAEIEIGILKSKDGGVDEIKHQQVSVKNALTLKIFEKTKMAIMDWETFETVKTVVLSAIESEIKEVGEQMEQGILPSKLILENRLGKAFDLIDFDLLKWIAQHQPLSQSHKMEAFSTLSEIGIYQHVFRELEEMNLAPKNRVARETWSLPFKICLLQELGFFELPQVSTLGFSPGKRNEMVSRLLDADLTNTKKQINALNDPKGGRDPKKYLSEVKAYLKEVLGDFEKLG